MSATFNSETFGSYFSMPGYPMPDPIFVGVQRYPTEIYYLDDLLGSIIASSSPYPPSLPLSPLPNLLSCFIEKPN